MDRSKALSRSWDRNARNWTRAVREGRIASRRAGTDDAIIKAILDLEPSRLLDVGCGEGWLIRRVTQSVDCAAVGIDGSAALIADARAADPDHDYRVVTYAELIAGTAALQGGFDVIVFNFAIFDESAPQLLAAVRPLLSEGGRVIIQTLHPQAADGPHRDGWRTEDFAAMQTQGWEPMPWYFRTLESWRAVIRKGGLHLLDLAELKAEGADEPLSLIITCRSA